MSSRTGLASIRCPGSWFPWSPWWSWPLCLSWCSLLCPCPCALARLAARSLALLPAVVGVLLPAAAGVVVSVGAVVGALVVLVAVKEQGGAGWFHLAPVLLPDRRRRCRYCLVILRQLRGLDSAAGLLVVVVAVVAVLALAALFFARGTVPWSGSFRCSWPCCRSSSACSCRLPSVRIVAGLPVVVVALVVLVHRQRAGRAG